MPTMEMAQAMPTPANWFMIWCQLPSMAPTGASLPKTGLMTLGGEEAGENRSQRSAGSVHAEGVQRVVVAEEALDDKDHEEAEEAGDERRWREPHMGWTKPEAGVMATRPATAPEMAPRAVGLPL